MEFSLDRRTLIDLADAHGTPTFVYDGDVVADRYRGLHDYIQWPRLKIFYAMKANSNVDLLRLVRSLDGCIDAVSLGEVMLALAAGFEPERILYTANSVTLEEMREVRRLGVLQNLESLSALERFGAAFPGERVSLRFNPEVVAGDHKFVMTGGDDTKFGLLLRDVRQVLDACARHGLKVVGLHEHTGSGIADTEKFYAAMRNLLAIANPRDFPDLAFVDFGGGFKVPYRPDEKRVDYAAFGEKAAAIFREFCDRFGRPLEMWFEPGKYVAAESGALLVRVNTLKDNHGKLIAGTDSGFAHLIRPVLYDAYHHILNLTNPEGPERRYDICGNICESGDLFAASRPMPEIREGDLLAILNAGAYCYSMASVYNLRPLPAEVLVRGGKTAAARPRLTYGELVGRFL